MFNTFESSCHTIHSHKLLILQFGVDERQSNSNHYTVRHNNGIHLRFGCSNCAFSLTTLKHCDIRMLNSLTNTRNFTAKPKNMWNSGRIEHKVTIFHETSECFIKSSYMHWHKNTHLKTDIAGVVLIRSRCYFFVLWRWFDWRESKVSFAFVAYSAILVQRSWAVWFRVTAVNPCHRLMSIWAINRMETT